MVVNLPGRADALRAGPRSTGVTERRRCYHEVEDCGFAMVRFHVNGTVRLLNRNLKHWILER